MLNGGNFDNHIPRQNNITRHVINENQLVSVSPTQMPLQTNIQNVKQVEKVETLSSDNGVHVFKVVDAFDSDVDGVSYELKDYPVLSRIVDNTVKVGALSSDDDPTPIINSLRQDLEIYDKFLSSHLDDGVTSGKLNDSKIRKVANELKKYTETQKLGEALAGGLDAVNYDSSKKLSPIYGTEYEKVEAARLTVKNEIQGSKAIMDGGSGDINVGSQGSGRLTGAVGGMQAGTQKKIGELSSEIGKTGTVVSYAVFSAGIFATERKVGMQLLAGSDSFDPNSSTAVLIGAANQDFTMPQQGLTSSGDDIGTYMKNNNIVSMDDSGIDTLRKASAMAILKEQKDFTVVHGAANATKQADQWGRLSLSNAYDSDVVSSVSNYMNAHTRYGKKQVYQVYLLAQTVYRTGMATESLANEAIFDLDKIQLATELIEEETITPTNEDITTLESFLEAYDAGGTSSGGDTASPE